jgi:hypothetical protein
MFIGSVMDQIARVKLVLTAAQFLSLLLMALTTGIVFSHLLQRGPKATLPAPVFLSIQQTLLSNYGVGRGNRGWGVCIHASYDNPFALGLLYLP